MIYPPDPQSTCHTSSYWYCHSKKWVWSPRSNGYNPSKVLEELLGERAKLLWHAKFYPGLPFASHFHCVFHCAPCHSVSYHSFVLLCLRASHSCANNVTFKVPCPAHGLLLFTFQLVCHFLQKPSQSFSSRKGGPLKCACSLALGGSYPTALHLNSMEVPRDQILSRA